MSSTKKLAGLNSSGSDLKIRVDFSVTISAESTGSIESDLRQILGDLGIGSKIRWKRWGQIFILEFAKHTGVIHKKVGHYLVIELLGHWVIE